MIGRVLFIAILGIVLLKNQKPSPSALIVRPVPISWAPVPLASEPVLQTVQLPLTTVMIQKVCRYVPVVSRTSNQPTSIPRAATNRPFRSV